MTKFKEWPDATIDVLCGGTPCQSFSVAGLRKGLDDPRGNLMLTFLAIAKRYRPQWVVWENVPGVLSSNGGRDFGSFLGGLAECGYGFAYRVLDAQYFGVAQRRKRVFVVGYLGDWHRAAAVLFEQHSLQGHPAPSREKGKRIAPTIDASFGRLQGCSGQDANNGHGNLIPSTSMCLNAGGQQRLDAESETLIPTIGGGFDGPVGFTLHGTDGTASVASFTDLSSSLRSRIPSGVENSTTTAVMQPVAVAFDTYNQSVNSHTSQTIKSPQGAVQESVGTVLQAMQVRRLTPVECERLQGFPDIKKNYTIQVCREAEKTVNAPSAEQSSAAPSHDQSKHAVVHVQINLERQEVRLLSPERLSLCASTAASQNSSRRLMQGADIAHLVALMTPHLDRLTGVGKAASQASTTGFSLHQSGSRSVQLSGQEIDALASDADKFTKTVSDCLKSITSEAGQSSQNYEQSVQTLCCCVVAAINSFIPAGTFPEISFVLSIETSIGYTAIPWRKKPASECPDGPRYKALGNSWAVPVARWIGERINKVEAWTS
jgi:DNA (cytosine-5)-methyltransferase 1